MTQQSAASRKDIRKAEKRSDLIERERVEGLKHLTTTYGGRLWLWQQMEAANIFSQTFTGDPLTSAFNEGQRARGLALLADLMLHQPETFLKMMVEHNERRISVDALAERDARSATGGDPVSPGSPDGDGDSGTANGHNAPGPGSDYNPTASAN